MKTYMFTPILLSVSACSNVTTIHEKGDLVLEIDRSFESGVSQTFIGLKSNDDTIYCVGTAEIDRLYREMGDQENTPDLNADENVNYLKGINISEPVYLIDDTGMKIFVDNDDAIEKFNLEYYKCADLINKSLAEQSAKKVLRIK